MTLAAGLLAAAMVVATPLASAAPPPAQPPPPRPPASAPDGSDQAAAPLHINPKLLEGPGPVGEPDHIHISTDVSERDQLREMAAQWHQSVQEGNTAEAADILPEMSKLLALDGFKDKATLVGSFIGMGRDWMLTDDWDRAERAFNAALLLDPGDGPAHAALAELAWKRKKGFTGALGLLAGVVQAAKGELRTTMGLLRAAANLMLVLVIAAVISAAGFAVVLLVKYNRLLRHGAHETLAERVPDGIDRVLAWVLLFVPVLLFLAPAWWAVYWLVLLGPYGIPSERRLATLALVLIALTPPAFCVVSSASALQQDTVVRAIQAAEDGDAPPDVLGSLQALTQDVKDPQLRFLLASLQSAAGRPDQAVATYSEIVKADPSNAAALVNRGNIHFRRGDPNAAVGDYNLAKDTNPDFALAWRNGSIAYAQDLRTEVATEWMRKAQSLDNGAVQSWNAAAGQTSMYDARLTRRQQLHALLAEHSDLVASLLRSAKSPITIGALLGLVVVAIRARRGLGSLAAAACEKCGRAFCSRCHAAARSSAYCTQCIHLYVKKDGVSPVVRTAKLREVEKWVAVNSIAIRFFNIVLPGAGSLYGNRVGAGSMLLFLWAATVTALLLPSRMVLDFQRLGDADLAVLFGFELALLVVVYLVALVQSLRHST